MKMKKLLSAGAIAALALFGLNANAGIIDANAARMTARNFINERVNTQGTFKSTASVADIKLVHSEASSVEGNAYYVFNVQGGGWVIVAGDNRAKQILAYSETGSIDMKNMPVPAKGYLNMFKAQIETMQNYKGEVVRLKAHKSITPVGPLCKTDWAQGNPFNLQCYFNGSYCSVGCAGTDMAQILNYWKYPKEIDGLPSYSPSWSLSIPALPATTFDYDLIVDHYTYWQDGGLYLANTTDEQKQEVAKLCRYAAQSCLMNFSPDGSGSNVEKQKNGFITMGYHSDAKLLGLEAWPTRHTWNETDYTDEQWVELINAQLEKKHPIPYSSEDFTDGHTFIVDGVDADGLYHVNWGWNGRCDGYFQYGAFDVTPTNETYHFNSALFMVADLYPATGDNPPSDEPEFVRGDIDGNGEVKIADVSLLINYLLSEDANGVDLNAADCDESGDIKIADVSALISYLLSGTW